jgi:uncharacterized protein YoxC
MNAGQIAALIAAVAFAIGVCAAVYALLKLSRLATEATRYLTGMQERTDTLLEQAHAAIDRTNEQLTRTEVITANVNEVTANVAELTEHMSALAALGRALAAGPVGKAAAAAYGVRRAVSLRRSGTDRRVVAAAALPAPRPELRPTPPSARVPAARAGIEAGARARLTGGSAAVRVIGWAIGRSAR